MEIELDYDSYPCQYHPKGWWSGGEKPVDWPDVLDYEDFMSVVKQIEEWEDVFRKMYLAQRKKEMLDAIPKVSHENYTF